MSNKIVVLECVFSGAQYFKLKIGKKQHLVFRGGKATLTEEQWKSVQEQLKEMGKLNLIGYEFGPVGTVSNAAVIQPIKAIRGFDKPAQADSPSTETKWTKKEVGERIAQVDAGREVSPHSGEISPEQAAGLVADAEENERLLKKQAEIDAADKAKAKAEKRAAEKAKREAKKSS